MKSFCTLFKRNIITNIKTIFKKFISIDYLTTTQIVTPITTLVMARETAAMVIFDIVSSKSGESSGYSGGKNYNDMKLSNLSA